MQYACDFLLRGNMSEFDAPIQIILSRSSTTNVIISDYGNVNIGGWLIRNRKYITDKSNSIRGLNSNELDFLITVMSFSGFDKNTEGSYPSMTRVANMLGKTREAIRIVKSKLILDGLLVVSYHETGTHVYDFTPLFEQLIGLESFHRSSDPTNKRFLSNDFDKSLNQQRTHVTHSVWKNIILPPQEILGTPKNLVPNINNSNYIRYTSNIISDDSQKENPTTDSFCEKEKEKEPLVPRRPRFVTNMSEESISAIKNSKKRGRPKRTYKNDMLDNIMQGIFDFKHYNMTWKNNASNRKTYGAEMKYAAIISNRIQDYYTSDMTEITEETILQMVDKSRTIVSDVANIIRKKLEYFDLPAISTNVIPVLIASTDDTDDAIKKFLEGLSNGEKS